MEFINLTCHDITLYKNDEIALTIKASGLARCKEEMHKVDEISGFPIYSNTYGEVYGLPEEEEGKLYILSKIVAEALKGKRKDLLIVADTVRDESGRIIGAKGFARIWE